MFWLPYSSAASGIGFDQKEGLIEFDHLSVLGKYLTDSSGHPRADCGEQLHDFQQTQFLFTAYDLPGLAVRRAARLRRSIEGAQARGAHDRPTVADGGDGGRQSPIPDPFGIRPPLPPSGDPPL